MKPKTEQPKGLLDRKHSQSKFELARYDPTDPHIAAVVSHYWLVSWDLTDQEPYVSETLPYPSIHLVFQRGLSGVFGVPRGRFLRRLEGKDESFGVSFRPGGFYALVQTPAWRFSDRRTPVEEVFGQPGLALEKAILDTSNHVERIRLAEVFLRQRQPKPDETVDFVNRVIDRIAVERSITRVEDVAGEVGFSRRQLERLFSRYVGASPKWVIQRYRLFEAAERLASDPHLDTGRLAYDLGYFDQAHFIKDFKAMVGRPPADYARASQ